MAETARPTVAVAVVHYGDPAPTRGCLAAVAGDPSAVGRRIALVDNSADFPPGDLLPGTLHLPCPDNPGFGAGANRGLAALRADAAMDALVVLNHDVEILPGFLASAVEALGPGVGAAAGPVWADRARSELWSAGGALRRWTGTVVQSRDPRDAVTPRDVGFLPGAVFAAAPRAWDQVGGFDESIFLYHEDVDLSLRLRRAGWRLRFAPGMGAVHHLGGATGSQNRSPLYLEHLTATRLRPHRSRLYRLYLAVLHSGWVTVRSLHALAAGGPQGSAKAAALWRGHLRALRGLGRQRP